jgi:Mn2+/Fe2+ NRAMP family transporter
MQFYLQSSIVEKGVTEKQYRLSKYDVIVGAVFATIVAAFIIVACAATLHAHGHTEIHDAADAAFALEPFAEKYAYILFALGLFNASLFAASILPLSTAYTVCEGLGFESGVDKKFGEAKVFYWLYTILIAGGAGIVLVPRFPVVQVNVLSQVIAGCVLPLIMIFMLLLVNKRELMGRHVNGRFYNWVAWPATAFIIALTGILLYQQFGS